MSASNASSTAAIWAESLATTKSLVAAESTTVFSSCFNRWVRRIQVGKTITADYQTISDALSHAQRFDRIEVEAGTYYESIAIPFSVELTTADNGDDVTITTRGPCVTVATDEPVFISRLAVIGRGQRPADCDSLLIARGSPRIQDCVLTGVHVVGYATPVVTHCTIENSESGCGLRLSDHCGGEYSYNEIRFHRQECIKIACSGRPLFRKNRIYQRTGLQTVVNILGGRYGKACAPIFEDNIICGTEHFATMECEDVMYERPTQLLQKNFSVPDGLIAVSWGASPTVRSNTLYHGVVGVHLHECNMGEEQFVHNRILGCSSWGVFAGRNAVAVVHDNDITRNGGGVRSQAPHCLFDANQLTRNAFYGVMVVDSPAAFVRNLVDLSECGAIFLKDCTGLQFSENTIRQNKVCGIEIVRGGECTIEGNFIVNNPLLGCLVSEGSRPRLEKNHFKENDTNVMVRGKSVVHLVENTLAKATAHSIVFMEESEGVVEGNDISDCVNLALIAVVQRSRPILRHNFIRSGSSAGLLIESRSTPTVIGNQFSSLREGIRIRQKGDGIIAENEISSCNIGLLCEEEAVCVFCRNVVRGSSVSFVTSRSGAHPTVRDNDCKTSAECGIVVEDGGRGDYEKNLLRDCTEGCVLVTGPLSDATITANRILGASRFGISVQGLGKAIIVRNVIAGTKNFGIGTSGCADPQVYRNRIESSEAVGILVQDGAGNFHHNFVQGCNGSGVHVQAGSTARFRENLIRNNGGDGVRISRDARCTFLGDMVEDQGGSGVLVDGDASMTEVKSAVVRRNAHYGVHVAPQGSCAFDSCEVTENSVGGVLLLDAGDSVLQRCNIHHQPYCVQAFKGGLAALEHCHIHHSDSKALVTVTSAGILTLTSCHLSDTDLVALLAGSGGSCTAEQCTIERASCGVQAHADAFVALRNSAVEACGRGVVFCQETTSAERMSHPSVAPITSSASPTSRRRTATTVIVGEQRRSLASAPLLSTKLDELTAATPVGEATMVVDKSEASPSPVGLPLLHPPVVELVTATTPLLPRATRKVSTVRNCKLTSCQHICIEFQARGVGDVAGCELFGAQYGLWIASDATATVDKTTCTAATKSGILVDGSPAAKTCISHCSFTRGLGIGGVLRRSSLLLTLSSCTFSDNQLGGCVALGNEKSCLSGCVFQKHKRFGLVCAARDSAAYEGCTFDTNDDIGVLLLDNASPEFSHCQLRNSEFAVLILGDCASIRAQQCTIRMCRVGLAIYHGEVQDESTHLAPLRHTRVNDVISLVNSLSAEVSPVDSVHDSTDSPKDTLTASQRRASVPFSVETTPREASLSTPLQKKAASVCTVECAFEQCNVGVDFVARAAEGLLRSCKFLACIASAVVGREGSKWTMLNSHISGNSVGVTLMQDAVACLEACTVQANRVGVRIEGNSASRVVGCSFLENTECGFISVARVVLMTVEKCMFQKNGRSGGIVVLSGGLYRITNCEFHNEGIGIKVREQSSPTVFYCEFTKCQLGIDASGMRTHPRIGFCQFSGNVTGMLLDEGCNPEVFRNVFRGSSAASVEVRHHADPTVIQNLFEEHNDADSCAVKIDMNGAGVIGNNQFTHNYEGMRVTCNSDKFVALLNAFELHAKSAVTFGEASAGFFTRNQCARGQTYDVLVAGSPALSGLTIERNGILVGGTGVRIESACVTPVTLRHNRFFGSHGTGLVALQQGSVVASENLFHCLHTGVRGAEGGVVQLESSLIAAADVGLQTCAASEVRVRDTTIVGCATHALETRDQSKLIMSQCRVGFSTGAKPLLLLHGSGELQQNVFFGANILAQCDSNSTHQLIKNSFQLGKLGVMMAKGTATTVRLNAIQRLDVGVSIQEGAGGTLQGNSVFSNHRCALQVSLPHSVNITKNYFAQDNEAHASIQGITGQDLAAVARQNNAVGHGGRAEGGERHIVPATVPKAVAKEEVLVMQFHRYLNALGVPPTDASSAVSDGSNAANSSGAAGAFSYAALSDNVSLRELHTTVAAAEERVLALRSKLDGGDEAVCPKGDSAVRTRIQQVSWDVFKPLIKLPPPETFVTWEFRDDDDDDGEDKDGDDDDSDDIRGAGSSGRGGAKRRATAAKKTGSPTSRSAGAKRSSGKKKAIAPPPRRRESEVAAESTAAAAARAAELERVLNELREQEAHALASEKLRRPSVSTVPPLGHKTSDSTLKHAAAVGTSRRRSSVAGTLSTPLLLDVVPPAEASTTITPLEDGRAAMQSDVSFLARVPSETPATMTATSSAREIVTTLQNVPHAFPVSPGTGFVASDGETQHPRVASRRVEGDGRSASPSSPSRNGRASFSARSNSVAASSVARPGNSTTNAGPRKSLSSSPRKRNAGSEGSRHVRATSAVHPPPPATAPLPPDVRKKSVLSGPQGETSPVDESNENTYKMTLGVVPEVPPPPPEPKSGEERAADAARRLSKYQAVWLVVDRMAARAQDVRNRLLQRNSKTASTEDDSAPADAPPPEHDDTSLPIVATDESGKTLDNWEELLRRGHRVSGVVLIPAAPDPSQLVALDSSSSSSSSVIQQQAYGGANVLPSNFMEDLRALVLRRIYRRRIWAENDDADSVANITSAFSTLNKWFEELKVGSTLLLDASDLMSDPKVVEIVRRRSDALERFDGPAPPCEREEARWVRLLGQLRHEIERTAAAISTSNAVESDHHHRPQPFHTVAPQWDGWGNLIGLLRTAAITPFPGEYVGDCGFAFPDAKRSCPPSKRERASETGRQHPASSRAPPGDSTHPALDALPLADDVAGTELYPHLPAPLTKSGDDEAGDRAQRHLPRVVAASSAQPSARAASHVFRQHQHACRLEDDASWRLNTPLSVHRRTHVTVARQDPRFFIGTPVSGGGHTPQPAGGETPKTPKPPTEQKSRPLAKVPMPPRGMEPRAIASLPLPPPPNHSATSVQDAAASSEHAREQRWSPRVFDASRPAATSPFLGSTGFVPIPFGLFAKPPSA